MKTARTSRRKGFTLSELCISIVLMSSVILLAVALLNLNVKALLGTELQTTVLRQDSEFASLLNDTINSLEGIGGTNVGDGLRWAYYQMAALRDTGVDMGTNFLVLMTDGEMNAWSVTGNTASKILNFYSGGDAIPPYVAYHSGSRSTHYIETGSWFVTNNTLRHSVTTDRVFSSVEDALNRGARGYMRIWADKIMADFDATTYLISLCSGMSEGDQAALQEAFQTTELADVNSLTDFEETFDIINDKINEVMWAFEGPRM